MRAALRKTQHSTHAQHGERTNTSVLVPDWSPLRASRALGRWPRNPRRRIGLRRCGCAGLGRWRRCMIGHPGRYVLPKGAAALVSRAASKDTRSGSVAPPHPPLLLHPRCRCQLSTICPRRPINPKACLVYRRRPLRPLPLPLSFSLPLLPFFPHSSHSWLVRRPAHDALRQQSSRLPSARVRIFSTAEARNISRPSVSGQSPRRV